MGGAPQRAEGRGMPRSTLPIVVALALFAAVPATASALDEQGYWAFADRMQTHLDQHWDERVGYFTGTYPGANGNVLHTYAVAARRGHRGPSRNDARARRLVDALVGSPPFVESTAPDAGALAHAPGFVASMTSPLAAQHMVFDV